MSDNNLIPDFESIDELAKNIILLARNSLLVNFRFLDSALHMFDYISTPELTLATDGRVIYYSRIYILKRYIEQQNIVTRDLLHLIMHCIFLHSFVSPSIDRRYWNLACDIVVENAINNLNAKNITGRLYEQQQLAIRKIEEEVNLVTAEKVYRYLIDQNLSKDELATLNRLFYADDHSLWYQKYKASIEHSSQQHNDRGKVANSSDEGHNNKSGDNNKDQDNDDDANSISDEHNVDTANSADGADRTNDSNNDDGPNDDTDADSPKQSLKDKWKDVSEKIKTDIEIYSKEWGDKSGGLYQNVADVNREKYNYEELLRRFAVYNEHMQVNDDEFDYIFYTYGLKLYKNLPLIEPLEYKEVKRIKEFVIALDTSGSCSGRTIQSFLSKTYNILKQTESFFTKINVHIIQCDAQIQSDIKITSTKEFDKYVSQIQFKGFGGTDFSPVFQYIDKMKMAKEFDNLKGLIYFTDGYGTFPEFRPNYDAAFVFLDEGIESPSVPAWAIKIVLRKNEIENFEKS